MGMVGSLGPSEAGDVACLRACVLACRLAELTMMVDEGEGEDGRF